VCVQLLGTPLLRKLRLPVGTLVLPRVRRNVGNADAEEMQCSIRMPSVRDQRPAAQDAESRGVSLTRPLSCLRSPVSVGYHRPAVEVSYSGSELETMAHATNYYRWIFRSCVPISGARSTRLAPGSARFLVARGSRLDRSPAPRRAGAESHSGIPALQRLRTGPGSPSSTDISTTFPRRAQQIA